MEGKSVKNDLEDHGFYNNSNFLRFTRVKKNIRTSFKNMISYGI